MLLGQIVFRAKPDRTASSFFEKCHLIISAKYTVAIFLQSREDGVGLSSPWEDVTHAHGNTTIGLSNSMPHGDTSLVVGSG